MSEKEHRSDFIDTWDAFYSELEFEAVLSAYIHYEESDTYEKYGRWMENCAIGSFITGTFMTVFNSFFSVKCKPKSASTTEKNATTGSNGRLGSAPTTENPKSKGHNGTSGMVANAKYLSEWATQTYKKIIEKQGIRVRFGPALTGLAAAGLITYIGRGTSTILPSVGERAKNHVEAAAEWSSVYRLAALYRSEMLRVPFPTEQRHWDEQRKRYSELIQQSVNAGKKSVIKQSTYKKYQAVDKKEVMKIPKDQLEKRMNINQWHLEVYLSESLQRNKRLRKLLEQRRNEETKSVYE